MSAVQELLKRRPTTLRVLSASGQLGYGIPHKAFAAGLARKPDSSAVTWDQSTRAPLT
jgi:hypothetical protein